MTNEADDTLVLQRIRGIYDHRLRPDGHVCDHSKPLADPAEEVEARRWAKRVMAEDATFGEVREHVIRMAR